jgi:hypothetical protein
VRCGLRLAHAMSQRPPFNPGATAALLLIRAVIRAKPKLRIIAGRLHDLHKHAAHPTGWKFDHTERRSPTLNLAAHQIAQWSDMFSCLSASESKRVCHFIKSIAQAPRNGLPFRHACQFLGHQSFNRLQSIRVPTGNGNLRCARPHRIIYGNLSIGSVRIRAHKRPKTRQCRSRKWPDIAFREYLRLLKRVIERTFGGHLGQVFARIWQFRD